MVGSDLSNRVLTAEGIGRSNRASRIVHPLSIHQEAVAVRTRFQFNAGLPDTLPGPAHVYGMLCPLCKISHQLHARCCGHGEGECLMFAIVSFFHNDFLSCFCYQSPGCFSSNGKATLPV